MPRSTEVEESIKHSIRKNGFPEKVVRLPFRPVYDSCKKHGTSLAAALKNLAGENIFGKIQGNHIEFRSPEKSGLPKENSPEPSLGTLDLSWLNEAVQKGDLREAVQRCMASLTPDQIADLRKQAENLSDEEKRNILKMISRHFPPGAPLP
ncbi:MAG: hypothetical protein ACE5E9_06900 [Nitrospinaceae bacterium]